MFEILKKYDLKETIMRCNEPTIKLVAFVSYDNRNRARDAGFHWIPELKHWEMDIKKCDLETKKFNFKTMEVK